VHLLLITNTPCHDCSSSNSALGDHYFQVDRRPENKRDKHFVDHAATCGFVGSLWWKITMRLRPCRGSQGLHPDAAPQKRGASPRPRETEPTHPLH
ncbi:unnamed protein product, partial [Ectocarpus sp. 12 AP-2014]